MPRVLGEELVANRDGKYEYCSVLDGFAKVSLMRDATQVNPRYSCTIRFGGFGSPTFWGEGRTQDEAIQKAEERLARLCRVLVQLGFTEAKVW